MVTLTLSVNLLPVSSMLTVRRLAYGRPEFESRLGTPGRLSILSRELWRNKSGPSAIGCMNECIVRKNVENKQKEWLMPPNLFKFATRVNHTSVLHLAKKKMLIELSRDGCKMIHKKTYSDNVPFSDDCMVYEESLLDWGVHHRVNYTSILTRAQTHNSTPLCTRRSRYCLYLLGEAGGGGGE